MKRLAPLLEARLVAHQHAHLGKAVPEHEALNDLEQRGLVVDLGLQVRGHDRNQALAAGGNRLGGCANFVEGAQYVQGLAYRAPFGEHGWSSLGRLRARSSTDARSLARFSLVPVTRSPALFKAL